MTELNKFLFASVFTLNSLRGDDGDGDGGDGGDSGDGGDDKGGKGGGETAEQLQARLQKMESSLTSLDSKNKELLDENKKIKDKFAGFEGLDPDGIKAMMSQFENDEEKKLLSEGKFDEVLKKHTERVSADYEGKLKKHQENEETYKAELDKANAAIRDMTIDNNVTDRFIKASGRETAIDDVRLRAKGVWNYEDGELIPRDAKGEIITGDNGMMTPDEWVEKLKEDAPHLFPESVSGGASGNDGKGGNSIDDRIQRARKNGNVNEYRRLLNVKKKQEESA